MNTRNDSVFAYRDALAYLFKVVFWFAGLYWFANHLDGELWLVMLGVLFVSLPIVLSGLYGATVRKLRRLEYLQSRGWLFRLISGRILALVFWLLWGIVSALLILLQCYSYSRPQWWLLALLLPLFPIVYVLALRLFRAEVKVWLLPGMATAVTVRVCPVILLLLGVGLQFAGEAPHYTSLNDAIAAQRYAGADTYLVQQLLEYQAVYAGIQAYVLSGVGVGKWFWLLVYVGGQALVWLNLCFMVSCFVLPWRELRRILAPLSLALPARLSVMRISLSSALITFGVIFILGYVFVSLEGYLLGMRVEDRPMTRVTQQVVPRLERIGEAFFQEGTIAEIARAEARALSTIEDSKEEMERSIDQAFARLEGNVDVFLDEYYTLKGEYARIFTLMVGDFELFMEQQLREKLQQAEILAELERDSWNLLAERQEALAQYERETEAIMAANEVAAPEAGQDFAVSGSLPDFNLDHEMVSLQQRLTASTLSGAVATAIVAKVVGKSTFKLAAKTLGKLTAGKAAGTAGGAGAGAVAGAAAGSVVPGVGTAIGAAIGGVVGGLAVGITVDKILIELEESVNREQFRSEIVQAIRDSKLEFKQSLGL